MKNPWHQELQVKYLIQGMLVDLEVFEIPDIIEILNSTDLLKERI
jgi:hypothetical protein